jgi:hypothetical protein
VTDTERIEAKLKTGADIIAEYAKAVAENTAAFTDSLALEFCRATGLSVEEVEAVTVHEPNGFRTFFRRIQPVEADHAAYLEERARLQAENARLVTLASEHAALFRNECKAHDKAEAERLQFFTELTQARADLSECQAALRDAFDGQRAALADLEAERAAHNTLRAEVDADLAAWNASCQDGHPMVMFHAQTPEECPVCEAKGDVEEAQALAADRLDLVAQARAEAESLRASGRRRPFITKTADGEWAFEWEHKGVDVLGVFTPGEGWSLVVGDEEHEAITTERLAEILDAYFTPTDQPPAAEPTAPRSA